VTEARIPRLPKVADARERIWIFDLDNTLYPASSSLFDQVDARIQSFIMRQFSLGPEDARRTQKDFYRTYGTTLRGLMEEHGLAPEPFLDYVHQIDLSAIAASPALDDALGALVGRKLIYTNGSTQHARNVTEQLGITHHFEAVFDIAAAGYLPKPERAAYDLMLRQHGIDPTKSCMIEDLPRNLVPAHAAGMTTVLVAGNHELTEIDAEGPHIHNVTDDLPDWLARAVEVQHLND
jgi:putative hydrolase of the HAD superfamily